MAVLLCGIAAFALGGVVEADELDQSFAGPGTDASVDVSEAFDRAQTFTVGAAGTLSRLRLVLAKSGNTEPGDALSIDVRPTDGLGKPLEDDGSALATVTLLGSELTNLLDPGAPFEIDLTPFAVAVEPGDVLAIVARASVPFLGSRSFAWSAKLVSGDGYPGGIAWVRPNTWALQNDGGVDLVFETYVDAPEPDAAAATALAAVALLSRARGRDGA